MKGYQRALDATALVIAGLSTSVVLARLGGLGLPDGVSSRQAALVGIDVLAVVVGMSGMVALAVRVVRSGPSRGRLTRGHLVAAGIGRTLLAVGAVLVVQHVLPWWRHQLLQGAWQPIDAHAAVVRWAPTEVVATVVLPVAYLLTRLSASKREVRARQPPISTATLADWSGIGPVYETTWWVCPTCDRAFAGRAHCRGTAVWVHDEATTRPTTRMWKVSGRAQTPVPTASFDSDLEETASSLPA
jgi:hypothetical protein